MMQKSADYAELMACLSSIVDKLVIVEGKNDRAALNALGVRNVITLNKPLFSIVEEVAAKQSEAVILTDLDREGKKLYGKLGSLLSYHGVKIDNSFRNYLLKNTKIRQIEGLRRLPLSL